MSVGVVVAGVALAAFIGVPRASADTGTAGDLQANSQAFVSRYWDAWSGSNQVALASLSDMYAPQVTFYGKGISKAKLLAGKAKFADRWPNRHYADEPGSVSVSCSGGGVCDVSGIVDWTAHSDARSATSSGASRYSLRIDFGSGAGLIVAESGGNLPRGSSAAVSPPIVVAAGVAADPSQQAYQEGHTARLQWEAWFGALGGDEKVGALFWSGQRSLPHPGSCEQPEQSAEWRDGCSHAQTMLAPDDVRRRAEPQFRFGWNASVDSSGSSQSTQATADVSPPPPPQPQDFTAACAQELTQAYQRGEIPSVGVAYQVQEACYERRRQEAIQAQQEAVEARRRADAAREAAAQAAAEARAAADRQAQQAAAEQSPDNNCRKPAFAGELIKQFNEFDRFKDLGVKAVDIEHLVTTKWDMDSNDVVCHGTFVLTNGGKLTGSMEMRPNVAGDMITQWRPD